MFVLFALLAGLVSPAIAATSKNAPTIRPVPREALTNHFHIATGYKRADRARVTVIGAYTVSIPKNMRLADAWAPGFLPVTLKFSNGLCFRLTVDYQGGTLQNPVFAEVKCVRSKEADVPGTDVSAHAPLRKLGGSWGFNAWADDAKGSTIVTAPFAKTFEPLFTADMEADTIMAMNSPDGPSGSMTLVGEMDKRLMIVVLWVTY